MIYRKSDSWNRIAPGKLWSLNDAKYSQNKPLMDKLIETAPHRLVEASIDGKWGGGAPFGAGCYDEGVVPGHNVFGEMATTYRDQQIAQMTCRKIELGISRNFQLL